MKCPYCAEEMKLGFINQDRYALKWVPEGEHLGIFSQWFAKGIKLTDTFGDGSVEAFFCEDCQKMIIDVNDKIIQRK